jgi:hypothetical protein
MKQAIDTYTADMYEMDIAVKDTEFKDADRDSQYSFHIEMMDGTEIEWEHLTLRTAKLMFKATDTNPPANLRGCGWKEMT